MAPKQAPFSCRFSRFAAQGRGFRRVALSQRIHRQLVFMHRAMLFFTSWTLSFHSDFDEIHLGRPWGPLGVPRTSPWTPKGPSERARGSRNVLSCARWLPQWRPWDPLGSRGTFKSRPWGAQGRPWDPFPPVSVLQ